MSTHDIYYTATKTALIADGWLIAADPYRVLYEGLDIHEAFGSTAEESDQLLGATKDGTAIAVMVASFTGSSMLIDFQAALGAYLVHQTMMQQSDPERLLYLALDAEAVTNTLTDPAVKLVVDDRSLRYIVIDIEKASIVEWKPLPANVKP
jgi:XisH protein